MQRSTILFDLDGTLTDPGAGIGRSIQAALRELGLPPASEAQLRDCVGPPLQASFAALGAEPDQVEALIQAYRTRYREIGMFENEVYPEVPGLLAGLRAQGCRLFVTTSKPTPFATAILRHFALEGFFDAVYGSNLDGSLAEKRDLLRHVHEQVGFSPAATALVGDRKFDISAARAHRVFAIGALWGYGSRDELRQAQADCLAESPAAVLDELAE